jgi:hypothetical protein
MHRLSALPPSALPLSASSPSAVTALDVRGSPKVSYAWACARAMDKHKRASRLLVTAAKRRSLFRVSVRRASPLFSLPHCMARALRCRVWTYGTTLLSLNIAEFVVERCFVRFLTTQGYC